MMKRSEEILLTLLRAGLCGVVPAAPVRDICWAEVLQLAMKQDVASVAWYGVEELTKRGLVASEVALDKGTKLQWAYVVDRCERRYAKQRKAIAHLASIYRSANIRMMILKGYGLSLCYPHPESRPCTDVDIWLYGQQQFGDSVVRDRLGVAVHDDSHHHTVFHVDGVMIENHFDFLNIHSHLSNRDVERELLRRTEEQSVAVEVEGEVVYLPPVNMHALFLVRHAAAHFAAVEIVLRHIVDWAMFVQRHYADIEWEWLWGVCREHKMERFLNAMNVMAVDVCGVDAALFPGNGERNAVVQRILSDILDPEFSEVQPSGVINVVWYKCRRWWANRWKHRLVYRDSLTSTFLTQVRSHLMKPKTLQR
jgi:hypothetical protein